MNNTLRVTVTSVFFAAVGAVCLASAPACSGGGGGCGDKGKCSADPAPTQASIDQCNKLEGQACGSQLKDYASCASAQQVCASDNTTDGNATAAAVAANCGTQQKAVTDCCTATPAACQ